MTLAISSSTVNDWSTALFSKLDTKNQGYIDKSDVEGAFAKTATGTAGTADTEAADKFFDQVDTDHDGKVSKSELSTAIGKVADELNAQFDQARVAKGGGHGGHGGPPPGGGAGGPPPAGAGDAGASASSSSSATSATSSTYSAAADTNGDGTVSAEEAAAYAQLQAAGSATASLTSTESSSSSTTVSATSGTSAGASAGLSKDQLTDRLNALDSSDGSDSRHAGALKKLVDNFDKADTNGDGKLSRAESRAYLKSTRDAGDGQGGGTDGADGAGRSPADALSRALDLLKAYVNNSQDPQTASSGATSTASSISTQA